MNDFARWLVQHAARHAPPALSERLEEEWLADLETRHGRFSRVRFGLGCCWARRVIALDFIEAKAAAPAAATGQKVITASYAPPPSPLISRRTMIFLLIVGLHVLFVYGVLVALKGTLISVLPGSTQVTFLQESREPLKPLPPVTAEFKRPDIDAEPPFVPRITESFDSDIIQAAPTPTYTDIPATPPTPIKAVERIVGGIGKGFPNTDDFYPPTARRLGEKGIAAVRVCVDERGKLFEAPSLLQSSGSARLDEGALKLARAGSGRYRASTEDGQPVSSCYPVRIRFELRD